MAMQLCIYRYSYKDIQIWFHICTSMYVYIVIHMDPRRMPFHGTPEGSPNGTLGCPDTGTAFQTHILAAQTRAQPSRRRHNGPDGSARVIVRNTLIQDKLVTTQQQKPKQLIQPRSSASHPVTRPQIDRIDLTQPTMLAKLY